MTGIRVLLRFAAIGAVLLAILAAFAYTAGWLSPHRLTREKMMAAFTAANGDHQGFRRNHAKGVCVTGWFESSGDAAAVSKAAVFAEGRVPLVGRFALAGGMPFQNDSPAAVRSMALRFLPVGGQEWRTGMNAIPVFAVNSAQGFYDQLMAFKPDPVTGKPDPAAKQRFLTQHPEAARAMALIGARAVSSGFADSTFNSLDAFRLVDTAGDAIPVRWAAVPMRPFVADNGAQHGDADRNYLFDELIAQIREKPVQWKLVLTLGEPGDPTRDATLAWPENRRHIDAGVISIDHAVGEDSGACAVINYDPLVLPPGIEPSDDPLLSARSAAYARSVTLRLGEKSRKAPGAVAVK